jgi:hypothetical protein
MNEQLLHCHCSGLLQNIVHKQSHFMKKLFFLLLVFTGISASVHAQDKIYRKNGDVINAKVIEIGATEIKYKLPADQEVIYVLETDRILKIVLANGKVHLFTPDLKDPEQYAGQRQKAIKLNFLSPLLGYTQVSFEKCLGVGKSYELSLAIIGAGNNRQLDYYDNTFKTANKNQFGFAASAGYKFIKTPDFVSGKTRYFHIMQGSYAKPVFYVGHYGENRIAYKEPLYQYVLERQQVTFAALHLELGKQWVFGEKFLIDFSLGFGYGFDNKKSNGYIGNEDYSAYNYATARLGQSPGLSTSGGIKVGYLFK